jgi:predicted DNA binding CopG/RHH family protein
MRTKDKKVQMRMFLADYKALKALASGEGLSMSAYVAKLIRQEAKKQGIPT